VAVVDPADDSQQRFIVWHYAYDPERHERRNREITAFDNHVEFEDYVARAAQELKLRKARGEADDREHFGGVVKEAGHDARKQARRELLWRLQNGTATDDDIAQASSFGIAVAQWTDNDTP
jgi:hypothetical protein